MKEKGGRGGGRGDGGGVGEEGPVCEEVKLTFLLSIFLIHLMACPCGSIMRGHLLPRVTITPFSVEKASDGKPCKQTNDNS